MSLRFRLRYTLKAMLVAVGVCGAVVGVAARDAARQRHAVETIRNAGGIVVYDFERLGAEAPSPAWLARIVGVDYLAEPNLVIFFDGAEDDDLAMIREWTSLEYLELDSTKLTDDGLEHVAQLRSLKQLCLEKRTRPRVLRIVGPRSQWTDRDRQTRDRSAIGDAGVAHICRLKTLQWLELDATSIGDEGASAISELGHLRKLSLNDTLVGDAGVRHFSRLLELQQLQLDGTSVGDSGAKALMHCRALEVLSIYRTKVTRAEFEELEKALPKCTVMRYEIRDASSR